MLDTVKMAGYFTSHAIWSVADGETLIPIVGYLKTDDSQGMERLAMSSAQAMAHGNERIENLRDDEIGAAFIADAVVTLDTGKTDALIVDVRFAQDATGKLQFFLPYRNAKHPDGFAIHRLQLTQLEGISQEMVDQLVGAFFDGLEAHEQGGKLWKDKYIDQAGEGSMGVGEDNTDLTPDEFETLKQSLCLVFFLVAAADGKVDKKEVTSFLTLLVDSGKFSDPLLNRLITNVVRELPTMIAVMASGQVDYIGELGKVRRIVDARLPAARAQEFKLALLSVGVEIASASGGFLGFGSKISKDEKKALAGIAACLGVQVN